MSVVGGVTEGRSSQQLLLLQRTGRQRHGRPDLLEATVIDWTRSLLHLSMTRVAYWTMSVSDKSGTVTGMSVSMTSFQSSTMTIVTRRTWSVNEMSAMVDLVCQ